MPLVKTSVFTSTRDKAICFLIVAFVTDIHIGDHVSCFANNMIEWIA